MKIKYIGSAAAFFTGVLIVQDFISAAVLAMLGYFLFDTSEQNVYTAKGKTDSDDDCFCNDQAASPMHIQSIVRLCISLLNLKGNVLFSELNVMKSFMANDMDIGEEGILTIGDIIDATLRSKDSLNPQESVANINQYCRYEEKLSILHLLFVIAIADTRITDDELNFIMWAAQAMQIQTTHFAELKAVYVVEEIDVYKTLGISTDATAAEIKKAYRKLALQYHPDKLHSDPDAEEKSKLFQSITAAYKKALSEAENN